MKAPDIVEAWKWKHGEEIIERLLAQSARLSARANLDASIPITAHELADARTRPAKDRYYVIARRHAAMQAAKRERER